MKTKGLSRVMYDFVCNNFWFLLLVTLGCCITSEAIYFGNKADAYFSNKIYLRLLHYFVSISMSILAINWAISEFGVDPTEVSGNILRINGYISSGVGGAGAFAGYVLCNIVYEFFRDVVS